MLEYISHDYNIRLLWCSYITVSYINLFALIKTIFFTLQCHTYFLRTTYRHTLADTCALLRCKFEKVEFLMFLMNVTNKSPSGGIL